MLTIQKAILHIFDLHTNEPIYSFAELDYSEPFMQDYIQAMIEKVEDSDNMKEGTLSEENPFVVLTKKLEDDFIETTKTMTKKLFTITKRNPEIPPADLLFVLFTLEEVSCLGIFKLNYSDSVTHFVSYEEEILTNQLIVNRTILPSQKQAIQEGFVINREEMQYHVIEKKHFIEEEGEKVYYFTEKFLEDVPQPSLKENISLIKKAVEKTSKAFNDEEFETLAKTKDALVYSMQEEKSIDYKVIADTLYGDNITKKDKFYEEVKEMGYVDKAPTEVEWMGPKYSKQKFKLDNGIELSIPIELYKNPEVVEFINNPDGTTSVIIKNIEKIKNLF